MAEFLLELFSEEIPARMQARAESDLKRMVCDALKAEGFKHGDVNTYSTPRRLTLVINDLPTSQPDVSEERRGPRADAPEQAIAGFLRGAGVERADLVEREDKKGTFLYAVIEKKGQATEAILSGTVLKTVLNFPWPKSQRWGRTQFKWVRPLKSILCIFDGKTVTGEIQDFRIGKNNSVDMKEFYNIHFGNQTQGHRFLSPASFEVKDFADYKAKLLDAKVILDKADRQKIIIEKADKLALKADAVLFEPETLLNEVVGLVEWPVVMIGEFEESFMEIPMEALVSEMKHHQKYFPLLNKNGGLTNKFVFVANIEGNPDIIRAGNERVLGARLSDAKFFWDQDCSKNLEDFLPALADIVFHEKLGTVAERVERCEKLAGDLAQFIDGCDATLAKRAAKLAKADLVSGMVGEFPDLQGDMGGYYAEAQGEDDRVVEAIKAQYMPKGPSDFVPSSPEAVAVALADKIDILVGFFAINVKPTGSKDPFALRRAALGVIRLITENDLRVPLGEVFEKTAKILAEQNKVEYRDRTWKKVEELIPFFMDRLKVQQKEKGVRHDLIDAVMGEEDDLVRLLNRVSALQNFLSTDDGENLLAGFKRASNILRIEEKKGKTKFAGDVDVGLLAEGAEKTLFDQLASAQSAANTAVETERFEDAMAAIAKLRAPIDTFFDDVIVNADDAAVRVNRLNLLAKIRSSLSSVADFKKVEG